jgi:hypothetical protein
MNENGIGKEVVDAAARVHRELGPGLLETVYEVGIERVVNGLPEENLGVLALRETKSQVEPDGTAAAAPPHR